MENAHYPFNVSETVKQLELPLYTQGSYISKTEKLSLSVFLIKPRGKFYFAVITHDVDKFSRLTC